MNPSKVQWIVVTVLCAALGVMTSLVVDARSRLDAMERGAPASARTTTTASARASDGTRAGNEEREGVARDIADLRLRIAALERNAHITPPPRDDASDTGGDRAGPLASAVGANAETGTGAPLAQAVRAELEKADAERENARAERWRARTVEKMATFAEENKLSDKQKTQITEMVDAETQEIRGLFRDARDSGDFATTRDQARALRAKTEENAKSLLDEDQFLAFKAMRDEERQRFMGGGGGGDR